MQGEIYVAEYMQRQQRLQAWQERMKRNVEWYALKEYWRAEQEDKPKVMHLYGDSLDRGLQKWKQRYLVG